MITLGGRRRIKEFISEIEEISRVYEFICKEGR
jgi:hypothetical protein